MSIGMILLIVIALLVLFGVLQRVLDRMALTDRQAIAITAAIFAGGWLPDIRLGILSVNIGGALVPLIVCLYLLIHTKTWKERLRCLLASALSAVGVWLISRLFPSDPTAMPFDPLILYGIPAGLIAWIFGRSRRSAFVAGILGVILADLAAGFVNIANGIRQTMYLGGAGALDAVVLSGVTAVLLCELFGETMERIACSRAGSARAGKDAEGGLQI